MKLPVLAIFAVLLALLVVPCQAAPRNAAEYSGNPKIVDVLYISRMILQGQSSHTVIAADPAIEVLPVPMPSLYAITWLGQRPEMVNRILRLYMPRNYQDLLDHRDMVILYEAPCGALGSSSIRFDPKWMDWFVRFVEEGGRPLEMWGGDASWGGGGEGAYTSWGDTLLDEILPYECLGGYTPYHAGSFKPHFFDQDHPLSRLPWRPGLLELFNKVKPKLGSEQIAEAVGPNTHIPWLAMRKAGKGLVLGDTQVFYSAGTTDRMVREWQWYQDFLVYLVYLGAGKPVPENLYRVHRLREEINGHRSKESLFVGLLEFVDKFGGKTARLYSEMEAIDEEEKKAEDYFRMDDYDSAEEAFQEIAAAWEELNAKTIKVKNRALMWVYLVEWFWVTGVALVAGVTLWVVMVRRRLYREVRTTRTFG